MAEVVPPIPYKTPIVSETGFISEPWAKFIRQVFGRIGGSVALSNTELADLPALELADVQTDIAALQATVTTLTAQVNGLNQGPVL